MRITASILYYDLNRTLPLLRNKALFNDKTLKSSHIFMGEMNSPNCAYVARGSELSGVNMDYMSVVVLGEPDFDYTELRCNMIIVPDQTLSLDELQNLVQGIFDKYADWTDDIINISANNMNIRALFSVSAGVLPFSMCMLGSDGTPLASTKGDSSSLHTQLPVNSLEVLSSRLNSDCAETDLFYSPLPDGRMLLCANIFNDRGEFAARIFSEPKQAFSVSDEQIVRYFFLNVQRHYSQTLSVRSENVSDPAHDMLRRMLFDRSDVPQSELNYVLHKLDWLPQDKYVLIDAEFVRPNLSDMTYSFLCSALEALAAGSVAVRGGRGIVFIVNRRLFPQPISEAFLRSVEIVFRDNIIHMGVSAEFSELRRLDLYYRQAVNAIVLGEAADPDSRRSRFEDHLLEFMLNHACGEYEPEDMLSRKIKLLREYDAEHDTDYLKTLRAFFEARYNATAAAAALYIHRTTFLNRMRAIEELCELDLHDFDERLHIMMSFRLLDIIK